MVDEGKGAIAFHIVMALCADLAVHDPERIERMRSTLQGLLRAGIVHLEDRRDVRGADDALRRLLE